MYYGTDGHIDLFFDFIAPGRCLMLSVATDNPNAPTLGTARSMLLASGVEVIDFPYMSGFESGGKSYIAPYLNFYICNGAVIVPVAAADPDMDRAALALIGRHLPGREVVPIRMRAGPMQGGAIHCLTQQVPKVA